MSDSFRTRLRRGDTLLGTMVTLPTPSTAEILADAGFDWLFIDAEHGALETSDILRIVQTVGHRIPCLVRVAECNEAAIKRVLDAGAHGVIVPQVNSAQQAAEVVRYARYAPEGSRGVGLARAHGYGFAFADYVATANDRIAVVVQAEHRTAVENINDIVEVEGVDAVLLGPYDLSASYNKMGQITDPEVVEAIDRVTRACQREKLPLGYFGISADAVKPAIQQGYTLIIAGVDVLFLGNAARRILKDLKGNGQ
ncbi:MAG: 2,4-dihydroxyhept-2-ene-1,7-dioic acid aldolase [Planctomycetaceae bacterium]|nr:2,4-dihydroxyhept-2-ene-1,7-dioic acid aldolase [Planctomycetaceae bacterium]